MPKKLSFFIFFSFIVVLSACIKDPVEPTTSMSEEEEEEPAPVIIHDTILPGSYFPAYPGSYWNYSNNFNYTIEAEYVLTAVYSYYPNYWEEADPIYTLHYLPKLLTNGANGRAIKEYGFVNTHDSGTANFFSEISNYWTYEDSQSNGSYGTAHAVISRDTSIMVNGVMMDSTVCICSQHINAPSDYFYYHGYYRFYKKDIGVVRIDYKSETDSSQVTHELVDYFINN